MANKSLNVRVAVITGASKGLGKQMAIALAQEGATVALVARSGDLLEKVKAEIAGKGGKSHAFVAYVRERHRPDLPAVSHVDGTARVQTVFEDENPRFWRLLDAMGRATGYPILLNTSFNVAGPPIVRTPQDAVDTFWRAGLDALVIGSSLLIRRPARGHACPGRPRMTGTSEPPRPSR